MRISIICITYVFKEMWWENMEILNSYFSVKQFLVTHWHLWNISWNVCLKVAKPSNFLPQNTNNHAWAFNKWIFANKKVKSSRQTAKYSLQISMVAIGNFGTMKKILLLCTYKQKLMLFYFSSSSRKSRCRAKDSISLSSF